MPCNDITENLVLSLDLNYNVKHYALRKKTCGAKVGQQSMLQDFFIGQSPEKFVNMEMAEFLSIYNKSITDDHEKFMVLKHFDALRYAFRVLFGYDGGTKRDTATIDLMEYNSGGIDVRFYIGIDLDPAGNAGCGTACSGGGCGAKKKE